MQDRIINEIRSRQLDGLTNLQTRNSSGDGAGFEYLSCGFETIRKLVIDTS